MELVTTIIYTENGIFVSLEQAPFSTPQQYRNALEMKVTVTENMLIYNTRKRKMSFKITQMNLYGFNIVQLCKTFTYQHNGTHSLGCNNIYINSSAS
jgi:hypothetical protein